MHSSLISMPRAPHNCTLIPTFTFNFLLSELYQTHSPVYTISPLSQPLVRDVSSANNSWFIANLPPFALSSSNPFPGTLTFTSRTTSSIYIYIKQPWKHHTALSQSNINRKPLTHIISHPNTRPTIHIKTLHCFQKFSSNSIHSYL